jgi:hypothetical protein
MYTYRERIVLGETECGIAAVNRILRELSREWPGHSYDLLSRNCNHFCDVLCERLSVPKLPGKGLTKWSYSLRFLCFFKGTSTVRPSLMAVGDGFFGSFVLLNCRSLCNAWHSI